VHLCAIAPLQAIEAAMQCRQFSKAAGIIESLVRGCWSYEARGSDDGMSSLL